MEHVSGSAPDWRPSCAARAAVCAERTPIVCVGGFGDPDTDDASRKRPARVGNLSWHCRQREPLRRRWQQHAVSAALRRRGGFSTSTLTHTMSEHNVVGGHGGGTLRQTVIISGPTGPPRRHLLQLRRIAGSQGAPISVECDGVALSALPPPATEADLGAATGWWVTPKANDSLWLAGGSLMVSLPQKIGDINATLVY